jgi:pyruvate dehydrogenase E2 component (dihydrolipoamide acetyltransferase)
MNTFNLPDLGEGLPDAEINEWFVKVGDTVTVDQPLVSMETAKAVVEVPSPESGVVAQLFGEKGDIIKTGAPLCAFEDDKKATADAGTVVGNILSSDETISEDFIVGGNNTRQAGRAKATPKVRAYARKLNINLNDVKGTGPNGMVLLEDIDKQSHPLKEGFEPIKGVRRAMVKTMEASHKDVVPVTLFDDADISAWGEGEDITVRLIQAICAAAKAEPALNAWYDKINMARRLFSEVNLGLATDTPEGLFVPVIHDAQNLDKASLRGEINRYKTEVAERQVAPKNLQGSTITLSNFGKFAGRYASPIIVPPSVAILGVGRLREGVVSDNGEAVIHRMLPLSLSFDHRGVTGGEATRFLGAVLNSLEKSTS